jgi:FkbM family methyltransferase
MRRFGTNYGGWSLPVDAELGPTSVVYSAGVGEDISFDLLLQHTYGCEVVLIDPTERAKLHYDEVQAFYTTGDLKFTGDVQRDYLSTISSAKPDFSRFTYVPKGLWHLPTTLKFYKPVNPTFVSHTFIGNMYSDDYVMAEVDTVGNIMKELGHSKIDLLKLDIEGAELTVLDNLLREHIYPRYLCVEFDLLLKGQDSAQMTQKILDILELKGYRLLENSEWNCTFEHSKGDTRG